MALLDDAGITLSRALGQNYVADPNTVRRIARLAGVGPGSRVVEIGAGVGSLTLALAETGAHVVAVETDRHVVPVLRRVVSGLDVTVLEGDAMTFDWAAALDADPADPADPDEGWSMVANLPYNIAVPLLLDTLATVPAVTRFLVMVQREVAERLAAGPGGKVYGIPSVKRAWWADAAVVGRVPASVFVPAPRVESALLRLERRPPPASRLGPEQVFAVVERAFGQRRKMIRRSLGDHPDFEACAAAAGVAADRRPEELGLEQWVALAEAMVGPPPADGSS
ncbi:MAG: 16S rRNA (adenine(1518)-N(6)/adenine(1519)-N(6))-dimethyltransferase RsmA [Acidimicrobiales bacterium]|nr:16S rRNA (adenine(1518)-N(6)/adenine(1519)-N(6))-dimethyltransferase RsmA [Acidimicrobiales bacterium]